MDNMLYWLIEYGKVLFGYGFLMFVWPLTIFRKYLKNKSVTFKFSFCVTAQVVIVNTVVLMLGLLHILNDWTLRILFYGSFLYSVRACFALTKERKTTIKYLVHGSFGAKNFIWLKCRKYIRKLENVWARFRTFYKKHWLEYSLLVVAIVYGVVYFSWGAFHDRSYGFSDMYVHHQWIYQLSEGNPFSSGIYPQGMHCVIYALNALFGIKIYSCILFSSLANIIVILLAIYCLLKEIFKWRFSAILTLLVFLTLGGVTSPIITCMSRLQCALPQEFAFPGVFLCATFLIRYLKSCHGTKFKGKKTKWYWNENLLVFMLAFISTVIIHFYATFMAFFLCFGIAVCRLRKIFTKERFLPLVAAVVVGLTIAVSPMVVGYATGIGLEGSLYWAMSVMNVPSDTIEDNNLPEQNDPVQINPGNNKMDDTKELVSVPENKETPADVPVNVIPEKKFSLKEKINVLLEKGKEVATSIWARGKVFFQTIDQVQFKVLYNTKFAKISVVCHMAIMIIGLCILLLKLIIGKIFHCEKIYRLEYIGYVMLLLASFIYMVVYCSPELGLPVLIDKTRICAIIFLLDIAVVVALFDMLFSLICIMLSENVLQVVSFVAIIWIIFAIASSEYYHGYLYFALSRYDSTVQITNRIIDELPEESFTIVSPTEEMYQIIEYGYHEEIITFLQSQKKDTYTIPTEYVFVYVEKRPLSYVHTHSFSGPSWLAGDGYHKSVYQNNGSTWPEYKCAEISKEEAEKEMRFYGLLSDTYSRLSSRVIVESKMYYWCEEFMKRYPNEMKVFYEDEYLICYYWKQNPQRPYNLVME